MLRKCFVLIAALVCGHTNLAMAQVPPVAAPVAPLATKPVVAPALPALPTSGIYLIPAGANASSPVRIEVVFAEITEVYKVRLNFDITTSAFDLRATLPGGSAKTRTSNRNQEFYFNIGGTGVAPAGTPATQPFVNAQGRPIVSPFEFRLVRLEPRKGDRAAFIGKMRIVGGTSGRSVKSQVAFTTNQLGPGLYRIIPGQELSPGSYAFVNSEAPPDRGDSLTQDNVSNRMYDFTVE